MAAVDGFLWQEVIKQVVDSGGNIIRPWFTQLEPISLDHGLLEIQVPDKRALQYCQQHATRLFTEAAQAATGRLVGVCFLTPADVIQEPAAEDTGESATATSDQLPLNSEYTFDTFVIGPSNRLAHAACTAVSESPGQTYNPLFIHGASGLGKTHMLQATCRKVQAERPGAQILMLSCETFINHFIGAVERGQLHDFRYRYRHADVLVVDDIQFLCDREQTQEEFFHTFNTLYQSRRQIILSCDRSPDQIPGLEDRLVSRFNWGLVARIDRPGYETRVAILHKKAHTRAVQMPEDVICFVAGTVTSNIRELEGAIAKIAMLAQVTGRPINMALAEEALGSQLRARSREISIEDILSAVTARYNVRLADLQSKKRTRSIAFPRQVCMFLARSLTRHSLEEIGGYFGGRDHTTVLHANKTIEALRGQNTELQATLDVITQELNASV